MKLFTHSLVGVLLISSSAWADEQPTWPLKCSVTQTIMKTKKAVTTELPEAEMSIAGFETEKQVAGYKFRAAIYENDPAVVTLFITTPNGSHTFTEGIRGLTSLTAIQDHQQENETRYLLNCTVKK